MDSLRTVCYVCQYRENLYNLTTGQVNEPAARNVLLLATIRMKANHLLSPKICHECTGMLIAMYDRMQLYKTGVQRAQEVLPGKAEMTMGFVQENPMDTMEDQQLSDESASNKYTTEKDLARSDIGENRKDQTITEPVPTSGSGFEESLDPHQHMKTQPQVHHCQKAYSTTYRLNQHIEGVPTSTKTIHEIRAAKYLFKSSHMQYSICGKGNVGGKAQRRVLNRTHTKEKPYEQKNHSHPPTSLKWHQGTHSGERPYKCNQCNEAFLGPDHSNHHNLVHDGEKLLECTICKNTFHCEWKWAFHMRIHNGSATRQSVPALMEIGTFLITEEEQKSTEVIGHDECSFLPRG